MKKRIIFALLALALCLTLLPTAAFAEGPNEHEHANAETAAATTVDPVAAVQALINALPTAETVTADDYDAVQDAYDAYDALSIEQQAQITGAEVFEALFAWFNGQIIPVKNTGEITYITADSTASATAYATLDSTSSGTQGEGIYYVPSDFTLSSGLSFTGNTTLVLGSNATLTVNGVLSCTGNLTITTMTGATKATLTVNGGTRTDGNGKVNGYGIYSGRSLSIYAGMVEATGGNVTADNSCSYGIFVSYGSLIISGDSTSVTATGGAAVIESAGIFCQAGADNDSFSITGGKVEAFGGTATSSSRGIRNSARFSIDGSANVTAKSGKAEKSYGIYTSETMTVSGTARLTAKGDETNKTKESYGINCVTINIGGNAQVTAEGGNVTNESYGIYADGLSITSGTVKATGGTATSESTDSRSYGICAKASVSITGGSVTATSSTANSSKHSAYSYGIYANSSVAISGGTVTAYSGTATASLDAYNYGICAKGFGGSSVESNKIIINQTEGKTTLYGNDNGPVSLSAYSLTYNGGGLELATDSTFTKWLLSSVSGKPFLPILPTGYTFVWISDTNPAVKLEPVEGGIGSGVITLSVCDHKDNNGSSARENGKCKYCGGAGALVKNNTSGIEYENFTLAYTAANNGETIALLSNVSDALTINDSGKKITLDLNGHNATDTITVSVPATITDSVGGGTITTLTTGGNVKIGGLLAEGYGFKSSSAWYDGSSEETSVSDISVQKLPFKGLTVEAGTNVTGTQTTNFSWNYGKIANFSIYATDNISTETSTEPIKLSGTYVLKQGETEKERGGITAGSGRQWIAKASYFDENSGDQTAHFQISATSLPAGSYTLEITVTAADYSSYSQTISIPVTVTKGTVTTNGPTANTSLTYNAQEQALVIEPSVLPTGTTVQYRLSQSDSWSTEIPKAKDADTYTVYWKVGDGGVNYEDYIPTQPVEVTIEPNNINNSMQTVIVAASVPNLTYNGQSQTPSPVLKLKSKGDNGSAVVEYETLTEDTDYTVTVTPQTDAGWYSITFTGKGNYTGTMNTSWSIERADYTGTTTANGSAKYGTAGTVDLSNLIMPGGSAALGTVTDTNGVLSGAPGMTGTKLQFAFANDSAKIGKTAEITVSVTDCTNYNDYTITVTVKVTDKDVPTVSANNITAVYTGSEIPASAITGTATFGDQTVAGSWSFTNAAPKNVSDSSNAVSVTFTPDDTANFNAATATITVTITKATPTGAPQYTAISTSGKTLADANLTPNAVWPEGELKWVDAEGAELAETTAVTVNTAYSWRFTPADGSNYSPCGGSIILYSYTAPGYIPSTKPAAPQPGPTFTDVPADAYYAEAVRWAVENGITTGVGGGNFAPEASCTRAQIVTFLWRAAGCPEPKTMSSLADVSAGAYYAKAVAWAVENGIADGIGGGKFAPDLPCTRAQAVAFLFRYEAANGLAAVTLQELISGFGDAASVPGYALPAFNWALASGIVQGANDALMPNDTCTRAQIVTMLYRGANR